MTTSDDFFQPEGLQIGFFAMGIYVLIVVPNSNDELAEDVRAECTVGRCGTGVVIGKAQGSQELYLAGF